MHFLRFCKGGTKEKFSKKKAEIRGLTNTPSQISSSPNQYAFKVQTSENTLLQTARPKVPLMPSYDQFGKDT